jgi:hypothetical protein
MTMKITRLYTLLWENYRLNFLLCFRNSINLISIIAAALLIPSCEKRPDPLFTNSAITGYVYNWESIDENPGIKVVASGPYGQKTTETLDGGYYIIPGLGNGTYRLDFIKEGYGTIRKYGIQLFGNDTVYAGIVELFKKYDKYILPAFSGITIGRSGSPDQLFVIIESVKLGFYEVTPIVFFMDVKKNVDYKNYTLATRNYDLSGSYQESGKLNFYFPLYQLPFKTGTEVFVIAYVANPDELYSGYFDQYLGIEQFSTLIPEKHSQVMSFIMP